MLQYVRTDLIPRFIADSSSLRFWLAKKYLYHHSAKILKQSSSQQFGKSFMHNKKRGGRNVGPWGTPQRRGSFLDSVSPVDCDSDSFQTSKGEHPRYHEHIILKVKFYDLRYQMPLIGQRRLHKLLPFYLLPLNLSVISTIAWSVDKLFRKPNWYLYRILFFSRNKFSWSYISLSRIFSTKGW